MAKVVVVGGGWGGCGAALSAKKAGADVTLIEKADELLGTGLMGGLIRNNGRFTAAEEAIAMGAGDLIHAMDLVANHKMVELPHHKHSSIYNAFKIESEVKKILQKAGVNVTLQTRAVDVEIDTGKITSVIVENTPLKVGSMSRRKVEADVFVDSTGTTGSEGNCRKYGSGCSMCTLRCPTWGPRVSIAEKAGVKEKMSPRAGDLFGAYSGAIEVNKESIASELAQKLNKEGVLIIPLAKELVDSAKLVAKACQQYALPAFAENLVIIDTGYAKLLTPYFPMSKLHKVPGFEYARIEDPRSGGIGNSIRWLAITPRDNTLKVRGVANLFCCGEKAGVLGHIEAIVTGTLAGHNAVRMAVGKELIELPRTTAIGDAIAFAKEKIEDKEGFRVRTTFAGADYFERMKKLGIYTIDVKEIEKRIEKAGLTTFFAKGIA